MSLEREFGGDVPRVVSVDNAHVKIHQGKTFLVTKVFQTIEPNTLTSRDILFRTGLDRLHAAIEGGASGNSLLEVFVGATASANGTTLSAFTANQDTVTSSDAECFFTPTLDTVGALGAESFIHGGINGVGAFANAFGGRSSVFAERIPEVMLRPNTNYLIRITNVSGVTLAAMDFAIGFYIE